jgi:hypothetical protein
VIDDLRRELDAAGVRGRWQRRALEEAADHLAESDGEFGDPHEIAGGIAAVVGTTQTRRAAWAAFAALALTGVAYAAAWALVARNGQPDIAAGGTVGIAATLALFFLPQVTVVGGVLMLWRAFGLASPAPGAELRVVRRRAAVALAGGAATAVTWVVYVRQFDVAHGAVIVAAGVAAVGALSVAALLLHRASAPRVTPEGSAGDVFDDLGLAQLRPHASGLAFAFAFAVGLVTVAVGWSAEGALADGLVRGLPEAAAVLGCYAALGRVLALR